MSDSFNNSLIIITPIYEDNIASSQLFHKLATSFDNQITYVKEHRLVDVRLTEQQSSGTVIIEDGCVKLTKRGQKIANFSRYFRKKLSPKAAIINE